MRKLNKQQRMNANLIWAVRDIQAFLRKKMPLSVGTVLISFTSSQVWNKSCLLWRAKEGKKPQDWRTWLHPRTEASGNSRLWDFEKRNETLSGLVVWGNSLAHNPEKFTHLRTTAFSKWVEYQALKCSSRPAQARPHSHGITLKL